MARPKRWIGILTALGLCAASFGVAFGITSSQVSRGVGSSIGILDVRVLADENLGLYHDPAGSHPLTALEFRVLGARAERTKESTGYIRNESSFKLSLIEPCRNVVAGAETVGSIDAAIFGMSGNRLGNACDRPGITLSPGQMVMARVAVHNLDPNRDLAQISFAAVFGAVGTEPARILFHSDRNGASDIYVMDEYGSTQTRLTDNPASDAYADWSPDRTKIAFLSTRNGNWDVYVMNADGSDQTQLTDSAATDACASWSWSEKITFYSERDGNAEIYTMDADGSDQTRLTDNSATDFCPEWSPDGSKLVFYSNRDGNFEIYVMDADGSNQTRLTHNVAMDSYPTWSPDGTKIAFYTLRDGNREVYVMDTDGSNPTNLSNNPALDECPDWSADGSKIAFGSDRDGNHELYVMDVDGSNQTRLTHNTSRDSTARWSPIVAR